MFQLLSAAVQLEAPSSESRSAVKPGRKSADGAVVEVPPAKIKKQKAGGADWMTAPG